MTPVWMVASGKGGVGKTTIATSLAVGLAERNLNVVLVDLDMGKRNVDLLLGMENKVVFDIVDVMDEVCPLNQALVKDKKRPHMKLLFASQIHDPRVLSASALEKIIRQLKKKFQYIVIDCPTGTGNLLLAAREVATHAVVVTTGDDIAMRDADRVGGLLKQNKELLCYTLVNRVRPDWVERGNMYAPQVVAQTLDMPLLGYLNEDDQVQLAQRRHQPIIETDGYAWQSMDAALRKLLGERVTPQKRLGRSAAKEAKAPKETKEPKEGEAKRPLLRRLLGGKG